jgi:hypothetical protein
MSGHSKSLEKEDIMQVSRISAVKLMLVAAFLLAGCDETEKVPDWGEVRLGNESAQPVHLYLGENPTLTADPGTTARKRVSEAPQTISVRDDSGNVLFGQIALIPDNTFAKYIVLADDQVYTTAGNVRYPEHVGSRDEQIKVLNQATFNVDLYGNEWLLVRVPAGGNATVDVPKLMLDVKLQRENGSVLFEQTLDIPRNAVISYAVYPDGTVIASGGEIDPNTYYRYDEELRRYDYYYW